MVHGRAFKALNAARKESIDEKARNWELSGWKIDRAELGGNQLRPGSHPE